MTRSYSAESLIVLPRIGAISTARLIQELLSAAAAEKKLPAAIAADQPELEEGRAALEVALGKRILAEGEETPGVRAADRVEDNAFGSMFDWLSAWARLPADRFPQAAQAATIRDTLFPDGLTFLRIRPADEWQEAELRLGLIAEKGFDAPIVALGGKPFLDELKSAHKAYGEALGITAVKEQPESVRLREAQSAAIEIVRGYVLRVAAHVKKKDPSTAELAKRLLAPLTNWKDRPTRPGDAVSDPAKPLAPSNPTAPTG